MVKSTNILKQVYQGNFVLRCNYKLGKKILNNKIWFGKVKENSRSNHFFLFSEERV